MSVDSLTVRVNSDPEGMSLRSPLVSTVPVTTSTLKGRVIEDSRLYLTYTATITTTLSTIIEAYIS